MSSHRHECPRHQSINEPGIRPRTRASLLLEPDVERGPDHDLRAGFRGNSNPDLSRTGSYRRSLTDLAFVSVPMFVEAHSLPWVTWVRYNG